MRIYLFLTRVSKKLQPFLLQVPVLLRIKEALKGVFFYRWRGRQTAVYIVSFPKSGRTWLRVLIGKAIADQYNLDDRYVLDTYRLTKKLKLPVIQFIHDGSDLQYARTHNNLRRDTSVYRKKKVIFLARDPRDLIVSNYYQATKRENTFQGDLSAFIKSSRFGIRKVLRFYHKWSNNSSVPEAFQLVKYEDLHQNPIQVLRKVLDFVGLTAISSEVVHKAVDFASYENMKKLEQGGYFQQDSMLPGDQADPGSFKVRKGKVGAYTEELSQQDLQYIQQIILEEGNPFYTDSD